MLRRPSRIETTRAERVPTGRTTIAREPSVAQGPPPPFVDGPPPPDLPPPPPERELWPWLLAVLVAVLAGLGIAYWITRDDNGGSRQRAAVRTVVRTARKPAPAASRTAPQPAARMRVPSLVGARREVASARLERLGLTPRVQEQASRKPRGTVVGQDPPAGAKLARGDSVTLAVSSGGAKPAPPPKAAVPNVLGIPSRSAVKLLERAGLGSELRDVESPKPKGIVTAQSPRAGAKAARRTDVVLDVSSGPPSVAVPDVVGRSQAEAERALAAAGLEARAVAVPSDEPKARVLAQRPAAGGELKNGAAVRLNVSQGPPAPATMPDLVGKPLDEARAALREAGLEASVKQYASQQPAGTVIAQAKPPGASLERGDQVQINVSSGQKPGEGSGAPTTMPNIVGKPLDEARRMLKEAGIVASVEEYPSTDPAGTVIAQAKPPGTSLKRGAQVQINVSNGQRPS